MQGLKGSEWAGKAVQNVYKRPRQTDVCGTGRGTLDCADLSVYVVSALTAITAFVDTFVSRWSRDRFDEGRDKGCYGEEG